MARPKNSEADSQRPLIDMKSHILTVASSLVMEKGVKETSLKDIAKRAGISKGTLYYYYSAKEDIIYDIADRNLSRTTDKLIAWVNSLDYEVPAGELIKALFQKIMEDDNGSRLHIYLINEASANSALAEKFALRYGVWKETLRLTLDRLVKKNKACNGALSSLVLAAVDGMCIQRICGVEISTADIDDMVRLILKAIS